MIGRRARFFADRRHRSARGKAHDLFEGDHPAIDDRQARGDATGRYLVVVVAAKARAARAG